MISEANKDEILSFENIPPEGIDMLKSMEMLDEKSSTRLSSDQFPPLDINDGILGELHAHNHSLLSAPHNQPSQQSAGSVPGTASSMAMEAGGASELPATPRTPLLRQVAANYVPKSKASPVYTATSTNKISHDDTIEIVGETVFEFVEASGNSGTSVTYKEAFNKSSDELLQHNIFKDQRPVEKIQDSPGQVRLSVEVIKHFREELCVLEHQYIEEYGNRLMEI